MGLGHTTIPGMKRRKAEAMQRRAAKSDVPVGELMEDEPPIDSSNVGARMMQSMGWSQGHGLGKAEDGITVPVSIVRNAEHAGLGSKTDNGSTTMPEISYSDDYATVVRKMASRLQNTNGGGD